ncbi:hypothetical protein IG631_09790 [Alternaria alternata]|nr:hypothetical protein IG631_09790 [Alternaria alternata]
MVVLAGWSGFVRLASMNLGGTMGTRCSFRIHGARRAIWEMVSCALGRMRSTRRLMTYSWF